MVVTRYLYLSRRKMESRDAGYTLPELLVAMTIFVVLLAVIGSVITGMYKDLGKTNDIAGAAKQNQQAFETFERQLRSANAIDAPVAVASGATQNWVLGFEGLDDQGNPICRQWRLVTTTGQLQQGQLQQRSWYGAGTATSWSTVDTGITNTSDPFALPAAIAAPSASPSASSSPPPVTLHQEVTFTLDNQQGKSPKAVAVTQATVVALNSSSAAVPSTSVCTQNGNS